MIKTILPKAGPQAKFLSKWETEFNVCVAESSEDRVRIQL